MSQKTKETGKRKQRDPDLANAEIAIKRAAQKARENARKAGVPVVIMKNGEIVEETDTGQIRPVH